MATQWSRRLPARAAYDSIWNNAPPTFLAPAHAFYNRSLSTTTGLAATIKKTKIKRHDRRDTYALRQAKARKDANLSRQTVLREQRVKELGDPIRGVSSPFVESFDTVVPQAVQINVEELNLEALKGNPDRPPPSPAHSSKENHLDHGMKHEELGSTLESSRLLTEPPSMDQPSSDEGKAEKEGWETRHANAAEAVQRIVSLANSSSEHRTKKNIERVVEKFGRHNTDDTLKPKAPAAVKRNLFAGSPEPTPRAGPDTGSSEVQIGILTAKIRVLADRYEGENRNDKINKRNLRLLLHRRQKLLSYMEKKERGSDRWHHMIQTLGLTPACWKGQIAVE